MRIVGDPVVYPLFIPCCARGTMIITSTALEDVPLNKYSALMEITDELNMCVH